MLKKTYIRDRNHRIVGSLTTGFAGAFETLVRDEREQVIGRTSDKFHTSRDENGNLVSINVADPGFLVKRKP